MPDFLVEYLVKKAERGTAGLLDRGLPAGQAELPQVSDALKRFVIHEEKFSAPNRAIETVAGAVPGHAERGRFKLIFGHAGRDVRHDVERDAGNGETRRKLRRKIIGMHVAGDDVDLSVVELRQVFRRALKAR